MDKEKAKVELKVLLDRYNQMKLEKITDVKSKEEEKAKTKLIRPLFEHVLGWNFEEDVTAEERISKGWVDYGFRINEAPKFFLEAKSLKEDLDNPIYFRQAVSYAYYKGCPWAILTNFETIKILNAEWEAPNYLSSHFMTINCYDFLERFDDLWLLSKEGFEQGLLDKLAERFGKKTKKSPLTRQLLEDFTRFRNALSKNIAKENLSKKLTEDELDESVQRILNRLIFIRNCEDRGLEEKKLWEAKNEARVWKNLKDIFRYYDTNYDSKLFTYDLNNPKSLHICDTLTIDDSVMREIIDGLYRTKDKSVSYDFSIIPADVLGTVYEQYLSHILKKTKQRASLSDNQVHRKEQGIYYTPTYIVEYIVRNTLGEILSQKKIDHEKLRVLDISCGSGSFLIKAYDVLEDYYQKNHPNQTKLDLETEVLFQRKVILLKEHIFGVDLDKQAVEIAQLNLLLKIAAKAQRLPVLEQNIKCGNSLIDDKTVAGDKAFNWEEQFGKILKEGGFDVVIGNPPYVNVYLMDKKERKFFDETSKYETPHLKYDLYTLFIEKGIKLLRNKGYLGFIIPYSVLTQPYAELLRKYILDNCCIVSIADLSSYYVFQEASVKTVILILKKEDNKTIRDRNKIKIIKQNIFSGSIDSKDAYYINQSIFLTTHQYMFRLEISKQTLSISDKMDSLSFPLGSICYISKGIVAYSKVDGRTKDDFLHDKKINSKCVPYLEGKDVEKYCIHYKNIYLEYDPIVMSRPTFPELHENKKILVRAMSAALISTFDERSYYADQKLICCPKRTLIEKYVKASKKPKEPLADNAEEYDEKYIVGLLNSSTMWYYYKSLLFGGLSIHPEDIRNLPIRKIDFSKSEELKMHNDLIELVNKMLLLNEQVSKLGDKKTDERTKLEEELKRIDKEINGLVYSIYGINEKERAIIEEYT